MFKTACSIFSIAIFLLADSLWAAGKIACVGNSITYGYGIESWPDTTSYPHHLQNLLRSESGNAAKDTVGNFGLSGLTIRKDDASSYWKGYQFTPARNFAADTVIIGLGTNDAKVYTEWLNDAERVAYDSAITADFESFIDTFQVQSKPRIFLVTPPYVNNSAWGMFDTAIVKHVIPAIFRAGLTKGVSIIDLHSKFSYLENPSWYLSTDTVHPSIEGAKHLAEIIYSYLQKSELKISQNQTTLSAPAGFGFKWYQDGVLLPQETQKTLTISELGTYAVSVKIEENTQTQIMSAPYTVTDLSAKNEAEESIHPTKKAENFRYEKGNIYFTLSQNQTLSVKIFDLHGRLLVAKKVNGKAGENALSLPKLPAERYVANIGNLPLHIFRF